MRGARSDLPLDARHRSAAAVAPPRRRLPQLPGRTARRAVRDVLGLDGRHPPRVQGARAERGPAANYELWSFVPPAVLPLLASNYPGGNQILLDGAPVVRETVWDRPVSTSAAANLWHTTLVAGLGTFGGYYAVNVTDADCGGTAGLHGDCGVTNYVAPGKGDGSTRPRRTATRSTRTRRRGPHFLWQLTDVPSSGTTEHGAIHRTSVLDDGDHVLRGPARRWPRSSVRTRAPPRSA